MLEQIQELLPVIIACVVAFNFFLSGLHKALNVIKDKTKSKIDNKAYAIIGKISEVMQKIVDYIGMNREH